MKLISWKEKIINKVVLGRMRERRKGACNVRVLKERAKTSAFEEIKLQKSCRRILRKKEKPIKSGHSCNVPKNGPLAA